MIKVEIMGGDDQFPFRLILGDDERKFTYQAAVELKTKLCTMISMYDKQGCISKIEVSND